MVNAFSLTILRLILIWKRATSSKFSRSKDQAAEEEKGGSIGCSMGRTPVFEEGLTGDCGDEGVTRPLLEREASNWQSAGVSAALLLPCVMVTCDDDRSSVWYVEDRTVLAASND